MGMFAEIVLDPGGIVMWLVVGLVAGWLAGKVMKGRGYGLGVDMVLGLVGSVVGGLILGQVVTGEVGLLGSILVSFLGACLVIMMARFVAPARLEL